MLAKRPVEGWGYSLACVGLWDQPQDINESVSEYMSKEMHILYAGPRGGQGRSGGWRDVGMKDLGPHSASP